MMDWAALLSEFGVRLLDRLGINVRWDSLPTDSNPITDALAEGDFVERFGEMDGFSRASVSKVATVCQMAVFDATGGPEGDGQPKALRRHWYQWYKTKFAQPFAQQLGDVTRNAQGVLEMKDLAWTGRLSQTYAWFVDNTDATYRDLWVEDASRMMASTYEALFEGCHIIVAVEKDSLFADFKGPAAALGARAVYSGKGKSSKAAIEKLLRDYFDWGSDWGVVKFGPDTPLIILHISDHDFDGEAVIGPTFGDQARRYTPHILEARVGIKPENVLEAGREWADAWYQVKVSNKGYQKWAAAKALFAAQCSECGKTWAVEGIANIPMMVEGATLEEAAHRCPECGGAALEMRLGRDTAHGFEVEALTTRDYRALLVKALLEVLPFSYIVQRLREDCKADAYQAAEATTVTILEDNESYQALTAEIDRLSGIEAAFKSQVQDELYRIGAPHVSDWEDDDDDPEPDDFVRHVERAGSYGTPWRPFDKADRTKSLSEWLEEEADEAKELAAEEVEIGVSAAVKAAHDEVKRILGYYDGQCPYCKAASPAHEAWCPLDEAMRLLA